MSHSHDDCETELNEADDRIIELQAELDKHRWIPVEERLPQPTEKTHPQQSELVWLANITEDRMEAAKAWYEPADETWFDCFGKRVTGTHWKPIILPEEEGGG